MNKKQTNTKSLTAPLTMSSCFPIINAAPGTPMRHLVVALGTPGHPVGPGKDVGQTCDYMWVTEYRGAHGTTGWKS